MLVLVPELDFPEIPILEYAYPATPEAVAQSTNEDEWVVPGKYIKALDVYFELIWQTERLYLIDKDCYEQLRNLYQKD